VNKREAKMHFANCAALAAALFTTLTESLRICSSVEAGLFLICSSSSFGPIDSSDAKFCWGSCRQPPRGDP